MILRFSFLAKTTPSSGDYTVYDGGFLRTPPGTTETSRTDDQKTSNGRMVARVHDRGHYLTLIVGKGLNSKDSSEYCSLLILNFLIR